MTLIDRLELQAKELENENYHTAAETMREAVKILGKNNKPSVPKLMQLIASMSGWGDQSSRVSIGHMPARIYNECGDNDGIDNSNWGWVASTTICGFNSLTVSVYHKELEGALLALAKEIPEKLTALAQRTTSSSNAARSFLSKYVEEIGAETVKL